MNYFALFYYILQTLVTISNLVNTQSNQITFEKYIQIYNKPYRNNSEEYVRRFQNFKKSLLRIEKLNKKALEQRGDTKYGLNKFSDLSEDEFQNKFLSKGFKSNKVNPKFKTISASNLIIKDLPMKMDWAFSVVETMESMNFLKTQNLKELSVQEVIDCAQGGQFGCNGGDTCEVLKWMERTNFKLTTESNYPLTDVFGRCHSVKSSDNVSLGNFTCSEYVNNEKVMAALIAFHGPIVSAVDATSWQDYLGGIIRFHCETRLNHAVQIVGYDFTGTIPYYIVRNSWGEDFGLNGYLHIAFGSNLCGIAERVSMLDIKV